MENFVIKNKIKIIHFCQLWKNYYYPFSDLWKSSIIFLRHLLQIQSLYIKSILKARLGGI